MDQGHQELIEIICVNDGSTDLSKYRIKNFMELHSNIVLIDKKNGGPSSARNIGIDSAKGEYITFLDADDVLRPNSLLTVLQFMEQERILTAHFQWISFNENDVCRWDDTLTYTINKNLRYSSPNAVGWIFNTNIIQEHSIRFNENMNYGEDTLFVYHYSNYTEGLSRIIIQEPLYGYRQNSLSLMHEKSEKKRIKHASDMLTMCLEYKRILESTDDYLSNEGKHETELRMYRSAQAALFMASRCNSISPNEWVALMENHGVYPYPLQWDMLNEAKELKLIILQALQMLFPVKTYYYSFCRILRLFNKRLL